MLNTTTIFPLSVGFTRSSLLYAYLIPLWSRLTVEAIAPGVRPGSSIRPRISASRPASDWKTLDAMHDLRSPPPSDTFEFRDLAADFRDRTYEYLKSALGVDTSYFRRALRPNEFFFVYPYRDSEPLKNGFLLKTQGESQKR